MTPLLSIDLLPKPSAERIKGDGVAFVCLLELGGAQVLQAADLLAILVKVLWI